MKKQFVLILGLFLTAVGICYGEDIALQPGDSLDLEKAQRIALADNPSLEAAAERVEQARQRLEQARALYFPRVDLEGGAAWSRLSETNVLGQSQQRSAQLDRDQERYQLSLVGSWVIFDGYLRKFTNLIAQYGTRESEEARRDGQRILLQLVAETYYDAQFARYSQEIANADIAFNRQQFEDAQIRFEQGAGSLSDTLNFKVQINKAKTDLLVARRDYEVLLYSLAALMGIEDARLPENVTLFEIDMIEQESFLSFETETLLSKAMMYRPDLILQEYRLERSDAEIGKARAPYYPTFGLRGSVDGDSSKDIYLEEDDFGATVGLSLSYNLYRGGADEARLAESQALKRQVARDLQEQKTRVSREVRLAYANLLLAQEQLMLQRSTTELVTKTRDLVREGYNAGQESLVRLNEAQRDLVRTQSNLALSLVGLYRFRSSLMTVTGESLLPFQGKDDSR